MANETVNWQQILEQYPDLHDVFRGFSHDVGNALAAILSASELLKHYRQELTEQDQAILFDRIDQAVDEIRALLPRDITPVASPPETHGVTGRQIHY